MSDVSAGPRTCATCSAPASALFEAESFQYAGFNGIETVTGAWPACDTCAGLVRARSWDALTTRSVGRNISLAARPQETPVARMVGANALTTFLQGLFEQLDQALTGAEVPVVELCIECRWPHERRGEYCPACHQRRTLARRLWRGLRGPEKQRRREFVDGWCRNVGLLCPGVGREPHAVMHRLELLADYVGPITVGGNTFQVLKALCRPCLGQNVLNGRSE